MHNENFPKLTNRKHSNLLAYNTVLEKNDSKKGEKLRALRDSAEIPDSINGKIDPFYSCYAVILDVHPGTTDNKIEGLETPVR